MRPLERRPEIGRPATVEGALRAYQRAPAGLTEVEDLFDLDFVLSIKAGLSTGWEGRFLSCLESDGPQ